MRIIRTSVGVALHRIEVISALTMTDLPEPVAPAISRWGIFARSTAWARPATSRPEGERQLRARGREVDLLEDPPQGDDVELLVGDLDPDRALARDRRLDPDRAGRERHRQVVGQALDPADLDVRRRLDLVLGHDRPGVAADDPRLDVEAAQLLDDDLLVPRVDDGRVRGVGRQRRRARRRAARAGAATTRSCRSWAAGPRRRSRPPARGPRDHRSRLARRSPAPLPLPPATPATAAPHRRARDAGHPDRGERGRGGAGRRDGASGCRGRRRRPTRRSGPGPRRRRRGPRGRVARPRPGPRSAAAVSGAPFRAAAAASPSGALVVRSWNVDAAALRAPGRGRQERAQRQVERDQQARRRRGRRGSRTRRASSAPARAGRRGTGRCGRRHGRRAPGTRRAGRRTPSRSRAACGPTARPAPCPVPTRGTSRRAAARPAGASARSRSTAPRSCASRRSARPGPAAAARSP